MSDEIITENEIGLLEFRDPETGELVAVQKPTPKMQEKIDSGKPIYVKKDYDLIKTEDGKKVADPESFPMEGKQKGRCVYPYNVDTSAAVIEYMCEGKTLREISKLKGMPPVATIYYWMAKHVEFKHDINVARKVRGEMFADEAIDIARSTSSMRSRADKLKIDTLKWAAKVNNPEQFSDTIKHTGDATNPITIVVDTGIRRNE